MYPDERTLVGPVALMSREASIMVATTTSREITHVDGFKAIVKPNDHVTLINGAGRGTGMISFEKSEIPALIMLLEEAAR